MFLPNHQHALRDHLAEIRNNARTELRPDHSDENQKDERNSLTYGSGAKAAIASAEEVRPSTAERSNGILSTKDDSSPAHTL